jgi:CRISPR-associated endonuclease/helicase Cas3
MKYLAHVTRNNKSGEWEEVHELSEHLIKTSKLSKRFARLIGEDWAEVIGKWHDLGKYRKRFQDYIRIQSGYEKENAHIENGTRAPHSTAGAIHAVKELGSGFGHIIAYLIAGHHAGLPDWVNGRGALSFRLKEGQKEYEEALVEDIPQEILKATCPDLPKFAQNREVISLWMRLLFSCLVDADFLDTESYMNQEKSMDRKSPLGLDVIQERFNKAMDALRIDSKPNNINNVRNKIYDECLIAAKRRSGMFSLTVPTGGGKTLSSLAFALEHARIHNKDRIIYAIPFTSIIEQNADVFRQFVGDDVVLEHHSNFDVDPKKEDTKARLATENWDSSLIVTTNVQLFESLFASRTSRCRKLHNIVNSVIILDEAQQIPRDFQAPITQMMQHMTDYFGVTWVLCTATQPVLTESKNSFGQLLLKGLNKVREIVSNPSQLATDLKRVDVHIPNNEEPKISWEKLSKSISDEACVLVIVNTRIHARNLFELLIDDNNNLHLSANMCAEHRTEVIDQIKLRLKQRREGDKRPLRVVSTQLIEAGVDVDFPVVYRAMAGLDSIAQSAGRCNREGKLKTMGKVIVFKPEQASTIGFLRQGEDITVELINSRQLKEPLAPESFERYFTQLNNKGGRDKHGIIDLLKAESGNDTPLAIQFREAAKKFRLIDNNGVSIIVPFIPKCKDKSPIEDWLNILEKDPLQKWVYKKLQRFTISLPETIVKNNKRYFDERAGQFVLLESNYHNLFGLDIDEILVKPEGCVF